jgi:hypothetical protein
MLLDTILFSTIDGNWFTPCNDVLTHLQRRQRNLIFATSAKGSSSLLELYQRIQNAFLDE